MICLARSTPIANGVCAPPLLHATRHLRVAASKRAAFKPGFNALGTLRTKLSWGPQFRTPPTGVLAVPRCRSLSPVQAVCRGPHVLVSCPSITRVLLVRTESLPCKTNRSYPSLTMAMQNVKCVVVGDGAVGKTSLLIRSVIDSALLSCVELTLVTAVTPRTDFPSTTCPPCSTTSPPAWRSMAS